jgi:cytochrome P450
MSERFYGKNILFETGDEWKFLRKAVAPAFKRGWDMDSLEGVCKNLVDTWGQYVDQPLDVTIWFPRYVPGEIDPSYRHSLAHPPVTITVWS